MRFSRSAFAALLLASLGLATLAYAGSATTVTGLYYTGQNAGGGLATGGTTDAHWTVSAAYLNGTNTATYTGAAYVLSGPDSTYTPNTSTAQWITAPGAHTTSSTGSATNAGGDYLPGSSTSGTNSAYYVYRLAFTIGGSGTGNVTNDIQISMTIAADDNYYVYVNPTQAPTVNSAGTIDASSGGGNGTAVATGTAAWNNTTSFKIGNSTTNSGDVNNTNFVIGTNYIYVVVANTDSGSNSGSLNQSGLLVYQVGSGITIDGKPVPEVGAILPVVGALGLFLLRRVRRGGGISLVA